MQNVWITELSIAYNKESTIQVKDKIQKETIFGTSKSLPQIHGIRDINVLNKIKCTGKIR